MNGLYPTNPFSVANMGSVDKNKVLVKLYAMHVEHELKTRKTHLNIKQLLKKVHKMENEIFVSIELLHINYFWINFLWISVSFLTV